MSGVFTLADERHGVLREFLIGQLNPDWELDHGSWTDAVGELVAFNVQSASAALVSLDELLGHVSNDASATRLLDEIGFAGFVPEKMGGPSVLRWLHDLRGELSRDLARARSRSDNVE